MIHLSEWFQRKLYGCDCLCHLQHPKQMRTAAEHSPPDTKPSKASSSLGQIVGLTFVSFFGGISVQCIVAYNISQGSQVARDMKNPMRQQLWGKRKPRNPKSRSNPSFLTKPLGCCHKCSVKSQGGLHFCSFATLGLLPVPKEDKMEQIQGVSRRILIRHYSWALCHLLLVRFQSDVRKMWCVPCAVVLHVSNILAISGKRLCHPIQKKTRRMGQGRRHRCRILATIDSTQLCHLLLVQFQSDVRKMWCVPCAVVLHFSNILAISGKRLCHPVQKKTRRMGQGRRHRCRILATIDSTQLCHLLLRTVSSVACCCSWPKVLHTVLVDCL